MEGLISALREQAVVSQKLSKLLAGYQRLLAEPVRNAYEREKVLGTVEKLFSGFHPGELKEQLQGWLREERTKVEEAKAELRFGFGRELLAALEGSGLPVRGQLPFLRCGLFSLKVDFGTGRAAIFWGPEIEQLKSGIKLEPIALAQLLRSYQDSLVKRAAKAPEEFLARLLTAYRRGCLAKEVSEGERLFLVDLLSEMAFLLQPDGFRVNPVRARFLEYPRVRFSYDLYLLKKSGLREWNGMKLRLSVANFDATVEKAKALWVPDNEEGEGTYYSYIAFAP